MCAKPTGKIFYSMGEVTEMFDVNPSLIRFWESKFDILKPHKNKKGNRLFTPADIENLKLIYHLVKEKGMTLSGAAQQIKNNKEGISRDLEVIDRLLAIKAMLAEIKQELKVGADFESDPEEEYIPSLDAGKQEEAGEVKYPTVAETILMNEETPGTDLGYSFFDDGLDSPDVTAKEDADGAHWEVEEETGVTEPISVQKIVEENITDITGAELPEEYIGELSREIAEEAATAAEVMEALAELDKSTDKGPEAIEQTLF